MLTIVREAARQGGPGLCGRLVGRMGGATVQAAVIIGRSVAVGGRLLIIGSVMRDSCLSPAAALAFGLAVLNVYNDGKSYTEKEYAEILENSGFAVITVGHNALADGYAIVTAGKKAVRKK